MWGQRHLSHSEEIRGWLDEENNWEDYARRCARPEPFGVWLVCMRKQKEKCGARLMEAAAHFEHGLKRLECAWPLWRTFQEAKSCRQSSEVGLAALSRGWICELLPGIKSVETCRDHTCCVEARYLDVDAKRCAM